jgi:hypothetical protein
VVERLDLGAVAGGCLEALADIANNDLGHWPALTSPASEAFAVR